MRIAILSDVHGNLTAFEAVLEDLRQTSPDLILHGGDLPHGGSSPAEIVDRIRDLGWQGVAGNTDEMLWKPESLTAFAEQTPGIKPILAAIQELAAATREMLGEERLDWLRELPRMLIRDAVALVHASPESLWVAPTPESSDAEMESVYGELGRSIAVYGHVHRSFVRPLSEVTVINTGSVSQSFDGDRRAAYLVLDDSTPTIRRVEYDVEKEVRALAKSGLPHANWLARILETASPQMP